MFGLHPVLSATREQLLEQALARAAYVAQHLVEMIDQDTWRASGGNDGQGHYEGDYHAERVVDEIEEWAALAANNTPTERSTDG